MSKFIKGILRHVKNEDEDFDYQGADEQCSGGACLILGADTLVGGAFAAQLASRQLKIAVAIAHESQSQNSLVNTLKEAGAEEAMMVSFNPSQESTVKRAVRDVATRFGGIDLLVVALEAPVTCRFSEVSNVTKLAQAVMDTNYLSNVYFTHYAMPHLRKDGGRVVALSDPDTEKTALFAASCAATLAFFETVQAEDTGVSFITVTAPNSCPFAFNASGAVVQHDDTSSDVGDPKELAKILEAATH